MQDSCSRITLAGHAWTERLPQDQDATKKKTDCRTTVDAMRLDTKAPACFFPVRVFFCS